jgi:uncharacterized cupin superfamily protein
LNEDEALYVIEGEYDIRCGDETVRTKPGSFVFPPREIPHKFTNVSSAVGTILGVVSPAGFVGFLEEMSALPPPPDINAVTANRPEVQARNSSGIALRSESRAQLRHAVRPRSVIFSEVSAAPA